MDDIGEDIMANNDRVNHLQTHVTNKIGNMADDIVGQSRVISLKIDRDEVTKIWKHFARFAEYDDLKQLHGIVIPEITKFE